MSQDFFVEPFTRVAEQFSRFAQGIAFFDTYTASLTAYVTTNSFTKVSFLSGSIPTVESAFLSSLGWYVHESTEYNASGVANHRWTNFTFAYVS